MKEATGELNSTLIVVLGVAALAALFFTIIWPMIKEDLKYGSNCANAICNPGVIKGETGVYCYWKNKKNEKKYIVCPYTG